MVLSLQRSEYQLYAYDKVKLKPSTNVQITYVFDNILFHSPKNI